MEILFIIVSILALIFLLYCVIPNLYARNLSKMVYKRLNSNTDKRIALTFDDGPDGKYTDKLLQVLDQQEAKVTFFVSANNAAENKELVMKAKEAGHEIGYHTYKHKGMWQMTPWESSKEFTKGLQILNDLGIKPHLYRPPWGTFHLFTLFQAKKHGLKVVLWSKQANDWESTNSIDKIYTILMSKVNSNDVVLLHDSGGAPGAPAKTIGALERYIPEMKKKGYEFVKISEGLL